MTELHIICLFLMFTQGYFPHCLSEIEEGRERDRRERHIDWLPPTHAPTGGHVPLAGIELGTLQSAAHTLTTKPNRPGLSCTF